MGIDTKGLTDLRSARITIQGIAPRVLELDNGEIRIMDRWTKQVTVIRMEEISGVTFVEAGILTPGHLHIATFENSTPPNRLLIAAHPQCLAFWSNKPEILNLHRALQRYLKDNPPEARQPKSF